MMLLQANRSQLVLVDFQQRLMPTMFEGDRVVEHAVKLGRIAQSFDVPVWGTEQVPDKLGGNAAQVRALCQRTIAKHHFSAVRDGLLEVLRSPPVDADHAQTMQSPRNHIVVAGCETHVCLLQTAMELIEEGFSVWIAIDACSSRTERNRDAAFDRLRTAGAHLVTTEMVAFEWCRSADHPKFRDMLAQIK